MLIETPSTKHLSRMYYELGKIKANCVGMKSSWPYKAIKNREHLLALACDMSRYDPRLFEILVNYFILIGRRLILQVLGHFIIK